MLQTTVEYTLSQKLPHIALLLVLLFSQIADAFACQSAACEQSNTDSTSVVSGQMDEHYWHKMDSDMSQSQGEAKACECCQQLCQCPPSMLNVGILLSAALMPAILSPSFVISEQASSAASALLLLERRPPKHFIS